MTLEGESCLLIVCKNADTDSMKLSFGRIAAVLLSGFVSTSLWCQAIDIEYDLQQNWMALEEDVVEEIGMRMW